MERVVFGNCLRCSDDEGSCVSRTLLACHRDQTVFLSAALHRTALIYQRASPVEITGRTEDLGLFIEAIKVLLRICITRASFDARFDYSSSLGTAFS